MVLLGEGEEIQPIIHIDEWCFYVFLFLFIVIAENHSLIHENILEDDLDIAVWLRSDVALL